MIEKFKICTNLDECLTQLEDNSKLAVAISLAHAHSSHFIPSSQFYCFKDPEIIYKYGLKFWIRQSFPYLKELNEFIRMADAGGLIKKWYSNKLTGVPSHMRMDNSYKQLKLKHFHGAILIWGMLVAALICIFILERIVHAKARAPNALRFWKIVEMLIDPDRHFMLESKWK